MAINKVEFGGRTLIDLTDTTATADKILTGYGAYGKDGVWVDGTAIESSPDGSVYQDAEGYVVLDDGAGTHVEVESLSVTENGTYTAPTGYAYSPVNVDVEQGDMLPHFYVHYASDYSTITSTTCDMTYSEILTLIDGRSEYSALVYEWFPDEVNPDEGSYSTPKGATCRDNSVNNKIIIYATDAFGAPLYIITYTSDGALSTVITGHKYSSDLIVSGAKVTAPAGYYPFDASKSVASGTAGTPTATKGTVSNHSVTVTPSVTNTTGYITGSTKTGTAVTVNASELVSGSQTITSNDTYDVTNLASVTVNVSGGVTPTGTINITTNGTHDVTNYATANVNVSGGGSSSKKQINFIDSDGTLVQSYSADEWANVTSLPPNPSHTGLVAQGWNWTKAQIGAQLTALPDGDIWVGQMYITESGDTEIDVSMPEGRLSPILTICVNGTITIDWGDNTTPDTVTGTSLTTRQAVQHTYASTGNYMIAIHVVSGSFQFYGSTSYPLLRKNTTQNENRVYSNCVENVRFGSGVTSIGSSAFNNCHSLASITIPSSVTSIGSNAFSSCYSLVSIAIPSGVTSIASSAFYNCYSLVSIAIPSSVTSIASSAMSYCQSLASITIPSGVTSIGDSAFHTCSCLASITIPSGVTSIESQVFYNCYSLANIAIPSGVTSIGGYAFSNCNSLISITIPSSVTSILSNAFNSCYCLASITIPSGVTSIVNSAFYNCYGMAEYHILPADVPTLGTTVFNGIVSDCKIYVPSGTLSEYQSATNWSTYASYMVEESA